MNEIRKEQAEIKTADGIVLSVLLLHPIKVESKGVIQFHSGTVMPKEYYLKLASYMAEHGFVFALFDYRGVGESRPANLRGYKASINDWGKYDASALLNWLRDSFPLLPIHLLAHSMGGQLLGLMSNWNLFDKIVVVASSSGNWHNFERNYRRKISWTTKLTFPLLLSLYRYVPGKYGMGHDWPSGVAHDWWYNSQNNTLMADHLERTYGGTFFSKIDKPIVAWFFSDDVMATPKTVPNYQISFPMAKVSASLIRPSDFEMDSIGHFGIFKEKSKYRLWKELLSHFI